MLPLKHTSVENVVGKGVFTVTCQKETLVLYTTNADESSWVEDIQEVRFMINNINLEQMLLVYPLI